MSDPKPTPEDAKRAGTFFDTTVVAWGGGAGSKLAGEFARVRAEATPKWQPFATAPKDGREVLVWVTRANIPAALVAHYTGVDGEYQPPCGPAWFYWAGHCFAGLPSEPTHWAPIPEKP